MNIQKTALVASATLAVAMGLAAQANAAAFYIQEQSTKAVGRAFSGEVSEMGAQQMWWNPAAVGGISGLQGYSGFTAIIPRADATNIGSTVTRPGFPLGTVVPGAPSIAGSTSPVGGAQNAHNMVNNGYLPNGGFAFPIGDHFDFGFTATSPYSFTTNYDADSWARYAADKSRLRTLDFQPVIAFHTGGLSVGAGPNIEYVRATLSNYLPDPIPNLSGLPVVGPLLGAVGFNGTDGHQYLKGSAWDVGFSAGFQYHNDKVDLGVSYKSKIKHKIKGHLIVDGLTDPILVAEGANQRIDGAHAQFTTPWQVTLGGRYHLTNQLTLNGQITRFGWEKFNAIALSELGSNPDQSIPENYRNTWAYSVGFDYMVTPKWTVRGGVQRDLSPVTAGNRDPRIPDGNRWNFAAGTSYALTPHMTMDLAASYDKIKSEPIDKTEAAYVGTPLQTIIQNNGSLHNASALIFSAGGSVSF
jgi:long-chain fatty acid transport protein